MPEDKENIKDKIKDLYKMDTKNEEDIGKQLHEINKFFLKNYKLNIDDTEIIPIETEIYYGIKKENDTEFIFYDGMIHGDPLQKNRFGQIYFHRNKNNRKINHSSGGVDICLSLDEKDLFEGNFPYKNYYLSILLRSILIKKGKEEQFISGVNTIQEYFYYETISKIILDLEEKQNIIKEDKDKYTHEIHSQKRIQNGERKENDKFNNLNSFILGTKNNCYEYLDKSKLKPKTINKIKEERKNKKQIKEGNYGK
ncbi:MAG: hypothetical protein J5594_01035 [Elusimicrobiaceae bacterium]|nr:hypothetical protein [Elusimicrobiaceae bacterium]